MSAGKRSNRLILKQVIIDQKAPCRSGVYAFWHKERPRCVYVGESENLNRRLLEHYQRSSNSNDELHKWIDEYGTEMQFCFFEVDKEKTKRVERYFIKMLNPMANKKHTRRLK